jgi:hypothetical protein
MKRIGDWIEYITEGGRTFYYNDKDGSFQWEFPEDVDSRHKKKATNKQQLQRQQTQQQPQQHNYGANAALGIGYEKDEQYYEYSTSGEGQSYNYDEADTGNLGSEHYPWKAYLDPESGVAFWYNELTHVSQWETPEEFNADPSGGTAGSEAYAAGEGYNTPISSTRAQQYQQHQQQRQYTPKAGAADTAATTRTPAATGAGDNGHRNRSASFDVDDHDAFAIAVHDHENDLGI